MSAHCEGINPEYCHYYLQQTGRGLPVYRGQPYQKGHGLVSGIGSMLKGAVRGIGPTLTPMFKNLGMGVGLDILSGKNIKESLKSRAKQGGMRLVSMAANRLRRKISELGVRKAPASKKARRTGRKNTASTKKKKNTTRRKKRSGIGKGDIFA